MDLIYKSVQVDHLSQSQVALLTMYLQRLPGVSYTILPDAPAPTDDES